jgi:hypothetical protein
MTKEYSSIKPKKSPNSELPRQPVSRVSTSRQAELAKEFGSELIISFPGISGPLIHSPKTSNGKEDK